MRWVGWGATSGVKIDSEGYVVDVRGEREGRIHIRCWLGHVMPESVTFYSVPPGPWTTSSTERICFLIPYCDPPGFCLSPLCIRDETQAA